jgi:hypothetical protein
MIKINYKELILKNMDEEYLINQSNALALAFMEDERLKPLQLGKQHISVKVEREKIDAVRFVVNIEDADKELEKSILHALGL